MPMDDTKRNQLEKRFSLLFETAKRSLIAADRLSTQILQAMASFEKDIGSRVDLGERAILPLLDAMAFVDFAFRFYGVVQSLPFINKDTLEMRRLNKAMEPVEKARHHLQHMRGDLSQEEIDYPLLGALSWANGATAYTVSFSQPGSASVPSVVFDRQEKRWVAEHTFIVKHDYIDLDGVLAEMHAVYAWLTRLLSAAPQSFTELKWGATWAVSARLELIPRSQP